MSDATAPRDLGDQHQNETLAKTLKAATRIEDKAFVDMMAVPQFRAFVWRLLERAHVFETSMTADPHMTAFREGERNMGLGLMVEINRLCPAQYPVMAAEAAKRKEALNG